jgi:hypothetical protein
MQRFLTVLLSCVLLLASSGFAKSQNRFKTKTTLASGSPAQAMRNGGGRFANSHGGRTHGNAPLKNGLYQNLQRRSSSGMRR